MPVILILLFQDLVILFKLVEQEYSLKRVCVLVFYFAECYVGNFSSIDGSSPKSKSSSKSPKHRSHRRYSSSQGKSSRRTSSGETSLGNSPFSSPASTRSLSSKSPESPWIRKKKEEDPFNTDYWKKVSGLSSGYETQQTNSSSQGTASTADDLLQMGEEDKKFEINAKAGEGQGHAGQRGDQEGASTTTLFSLDEVEPASVPLVAAYEDDDGDHR